MTTHRSFTSAADGAIPQIDKDPQDVLDYELDWADWLAGEDTISASDYFAFDSNGVAVDPMDPDVLVIESDTFLDPTTTVWLSGGILGATYTLVNRVTTAGGRTKDQSWRCRIKAQ